MIQSIKQHLKDNYDTVYKLLNYFGYKDISKHGDEIRAAKPNGNNSSSVRIKMNDYMTADDFSIAYNGDIIGLISLHKEMTYGEVVNIIKMMIDNIIVEVKNEQELFDGFFDDSFKSNYDYKLKTYDKSVLNKYEKCWNIRFLKDNIFPGTQMEFNIGYDYESKRISIPWFDIEGNIIGVMGRINFDADTKYKYLPLIAFPKQFALFGLYQNKESIENNRVYIFESEKSVLQAHGYGYKNCVALGGNCIHNTQINELLKLNVKEFILCFDEGLEQDIIKKSIKNIRDCLFMREDVKIGVLLDKTYKYMEEGSKMSPTDKNKKTWEKLIEECIVIGR